MSRSDSSSVLRIGVAQAKTLAKKAIERTLETRKERQHKYIEEHREYLNNRFMHRLFRQKDFTHDEAKDDIFSDWGQTYIYSCDVRFWGENTIDRANRVLKACSSNTDEFYLSTEDFNAIREVETK